MGRRGSSRYGNFRSFGGGGRVDVPLSSGKMGSYRSRERGAEGSGGTVYPSVLESYNRDSDYKRWKAGLDYFQGIGQSWADYELSLLVRSFLDDGSKPGVKPTRLVFFPSRSSPDASWTVVNQLRGAVILDQPLLDADMSVDTVATSESAHRLILDVSGTLSSTQLANWKLYIGDQFEDGAISTAYPNGILPSTTESVAYTLVGVDVAGGRLLFDVSRPFIIGLVGPRAYWRKGKYDRTRPRTWKGDGTRFLCSSHRLYCSCPDFTGRAIAELSDSTSSRQELFPTPSAGRSVSSLTEAQAAGYYNQWRDLSIRADQRRECKHIHAVRWSIGFPFLEPSDYATGMSLLGQDMESQRGAFSSADILRYHQRRQLTIDRLAPALAAASGLPLDTRTELPRGLVLDRSNGVPVLWTTELEPSISNAIGGDWWIRKGGNAIFMFNPSIGKFVQTKLVGSLQKPVVETVEEFGIVSAE